MERAEGVDREGVTVDNQEATDKRTGQRRLQWTEYEG